ncbi:hypothetical protein A3K02_02035 [candidate division WS6 bacterium RIFOXYD1_FULL_33_8]|nr:MAG: hypothetical protein A3K02_02035 [candidate division WS6 bacterium RIFOXYD1_FULL_33_8]
MATLEESSLISFETLSSSAKSAKEAFILATSIPLNIISFKMVLSQEDGPIVATIFVLANSLMNI